MNTKTASPSNDSATDESSIEYQFDNEKNPGDIINTTGDIVDAVDNASDQASSEIGLSGRYRSRLGSMENGSIIVNLQHEVIVTNYPVMDPFQAFAYMHKYIESMQNIFRSSDLLTLDNIRNFREEMEQSAQEVNVGLFPNYAQPSLQDIAAEFLAFQKPMSKLWQDESCRLQSKHGTIDFSKKSITSEEHNLEILTGGIEKIHSKETLLIKKPDLLGSSMWDLRRGDRTINASIQDIGWLKRFQNTGQVQPGSGIIVDLLENKYFDVDGKLFKSEYFIEKVYGQTSP